MSGHHSEEVHITRSIKVFVSDKFSLTSTHSDPVEKNRQLKQYSSTTQLCFIVGGGWIFF